MLRLNVIGLQISIYTHIELSTDFYLLGRTLSI